jgi:predicted neutral ceramidase superfamily lipid hydrolase
MSCTLCLGHRKAGNKNLSTTFLSFFLLRTAMYFPSILLFLWCSLLILVSFMMNTEIVMPFFVGHWSTLVFLGCWRISFRSSELLLLSMVVLGILIVFTIPRCRINNVYLKLIKQSLAPLWIVYPSPLLLINEERDVCICYWLL